MSYRRDDSGSFHGNHFLNQQSMTGHPSMSHSSMMQGPPRVPPLPMMQGPPRIPPPSMMQGPPRMPPPPMMQGAPRIPPPPMMQGPPRVPPPHSLTHPANDGGPLRQTAPQNEHQYRMPPPSIGPPSRHSYNQDSHFADNQSGHRNQISSMQNQYQGFQSSNTQQFPSNQSFNMNPHPSNQSSNIHQAPSNQTPNTHFTSNPSNANQFVRNQQSSAHFSGIQSSNTQFPGQQPQPFPSNQPPGSYINQSSILANDSDLIPSNENERQHMQDQLWVSGWLSRKQKTPGKVIKETGKVKLCDARRILMEWLSLLDELKTSAEKHCESRDGATFDLQARLKSVMAEFHQTTNVTSLKKCVLNQRKKRERRKKRRQEAFDEAQDKLEVLQRKHETIDEMQRNIIQKDQDIKLAKEMKEEADKILSQVRKKKAEATRAMDLLDNLKKLRQLRKERASAQGLYPPVDSDKLFDSKLKHYGKLMKRQLLTYEDEESTLKVMLETEQVETEKKENYHAAKKLESQFRNWQKLVTRVLFGPKGNVEPGDELYPFQQYYKQAENDFQAFVNIRSQWDMFLVPPGTPGGSRIPSNWVLPSMDNTDHGVKDDK